MLMRIFRNRYHFSVKNIILYSGLVGGTIACYYLNNQESFVNTQSYERYVKNNCSKSEIKLLLPDITFYERINVGHSYYSNYENDYLKLFKNIIWDGCGTLLSCTSCDANNMEKSAKKFNTIKYSEVLEHGPQSKNGYWVIYKNKVYDITDFIEMHPGGSIIMTAVGKHLDPFFGVYKFHASEEVNEYLEGMQIGVIEDGFDYESLKHTLEKDKSHSDIFQYEPKRDKNLHIINEKPCSAETPTELLSNSFLTPQNIFFVRHHLAVPNIPDEDTHNVEFCIEENLANKDVVNDNRKYYNEIKNGRKCYCRRYTVSEIKDFFDEYDVIAALQCAGNRRQEMNEVESVKGLQWSGGAIGNAKWTGIRVKDLILDDEIYKVQDKNNIKTHLVMVGSDYDSHSDEHYEASISMSKALDPDTLIAHKMNNEELSIDQGFPLKVVVPGFCGARNVKWLKTLIISENESNSRWQKTDYKLLPASIKFGQPFDASKFAPIHGTPVTSFICNPKDGSTINVETEPDGISTYKVTGYAYSGNGIAIKTVEVSTDQGKTWIPAKLETVCDESQRMRCWSWTLWEAQVPVNKSNKELDIIVRAYDYNCNTQPESPEHIWNMRGLLNNSWNHSKVTIN